MSYFIDLTIFRLIISRSLRDPPLSHVQRPASPSDKDRNSLSTVAILAQGTSWAVASTQASVLEGGAASRCSKCSTRRENAIEHTRGKGRKDKKETSAFELLDSRRVFEDLASSA